MTRRPPFHAWRCTSKSKAIARSVAISGLLSMIGAIGACSLDLGTTPFACSDGATCPEGFTCRATVCVAAGTAQPVSRPMRVTYINSAEMYWFDGREGGATLLVNDGFSPGAKGIFEIHVGEDGAVTGPKKLVDFGGEFPVSSSIVALDDTHYGALTLSFPAEDESASRIELLSLEREAAGAPAKKVLFSRDLPYVGGYEPPYISAIVHDGNLITAYTNPTEGGRVEIEKRSLDGSLVDSFDFPLPDGVLPLSGDCLLWQTPSDKLVLRVGLDTIGVVVIDVAAKTATQLASADGVPVYAFDQSVTWLETADDGTASYVTRSLDGKEIKRTGALGTQDGLEPYTAVPGEGGALIAPISSTADFAALGVDRFDGTGAMSLAASFDRPTDDSLYSARAHTRDGHVYVAWTAFHDSLMDLWVGAAAESK